PRSQTPRSGRLRRRGSAGPHRSGGAVPPTRFREPERDGCCVGTSAGCSRSGRRCPRSDGRFSPSSLVRSSGQQLFLPYTPFVLATARPAYSGRGDWQPVLPSLVVTSMRSEEHTSELQSRFDIVCRLLLEKK